jgi:hypothetical protein
MIEWLNREQYDSDPARNPVIIVRGKVSRESFVSFVYDEGIKPATGYEFKHPSYFYVRASETGRLEEIPVGDPGGFWVTIVRIIKKKEGGR